MDIVMAREGQGDVLEHQDAERVGRSTSRSSDGISYPPHSWPTTIQPCRPREKPEHPIATQSLGVSSLCKGSLGRTLTECRPTDNESGRETPAICLRKGRYSLVPRVVDRLDSGGDEPSPPSEHRDEL